MSSSRMKKPQLRRSTNGGVMAIKENISRKTLFSDHENLTARPNVLKLSDPDPTEGASGRKPQHRVIENTGSTPPDSTGYTYLVSNIASGDGISARQGLRVRVKEGIVRLFVATTPDYANVTSQALRVLLIQDKQQVADTDPVVDQIMEDTAVSQAPITWAHDKDFPGRFRILDDQLAYFGPSDTTTVMELRFRLDRPDNVLFNGTNATDIQKGGIYLVFLSSASTSPTPANYFSKFQWESRLIYTNV